MNKPEIRNLLERVQAHRQNFLITDSVVTEWSKRLERYDSQDVNNNLDNYLKNDFEKRIPSVYELIKELTPLKEYQVSYEYKTNCPICNRLLNSTEYDKHYDRCSSVDYICRNRKKYFDKETDKGALWKLSDIEFANKYWKFCELLYDNEKLSRIEKVTLRNAILTHYGHEPEGNALDETKELLIK